MLMELVIFEFYTLVIQVLFWWGIVMLIGLEVLMIEKAHQEDVSF